MNDRQQQRGERAYRALRFFGQVGRAAFGKGGLKAAGKLANRANVALAAVDAALSLLDAANSYVQCQKAKQVTENLLGQFEVLRKELTMEKVELKSLIEETELWAENRSNVRSLSLSVLEPVDRVLSLVQINLIQEAQEEIVDLERLHELERRHEQALDKYQSAVDVIMEDNPFCEDSEVPEIEEE